MDLPQLIEEYKFWSLDEGKGRLGTDKEIVRRLNTAYRFLSSRAHRAPDSAWLQVVDDIPVVQDRRRYPLPPRTRSVILVLLVKSTTDPDSEVFEIRQTTALGVSGKFPIFPVVKWRLEGRYLVFEGPKLNTSDFQGIRITRQVHPAELSAGVVKNIVAGTANEIGGGPSIATHTVTLENVPTLGDTLGETDYYNGAILRLGAGAGIHAEAEVRDTVVTTSPSLKVDLVVNSLGSAVGAAGTTRYSFVPNLPEEFHALIAVDAAYHALLTEDSPASPKVGQARAELLQQFREDLEWRASQEAGGVILRQEFYEVEP